MNLSERDQVAAAAIAYALISGKEGIELRAITALASSIAAGKGDHPIRETTGEGLREDTEQLKDRLLEFLGNQSKYGKVF